MRYILDICEIVTKSHRVTIDTDRPLDDICDEIESHKPRLMNVWDIQYLVWRLTKMNTESLSLKLSGQRGIRRMKR